MFSFGAPDNTRKVWSKCAQALLHKQRVERLMLLCQTTRIDHDSLSQIASYWRICQPTFEQPSWKLDPFLFKIMNPQSILVHYSYDSTYSLVLYLTILQALFLELSSTYLTYVHHSRVTLLFWTTPQVYILDVSYSLCTTWTCWRPNLDLTYNSWNSHC
jgi:hypothetical protein